MKRFRERIVEFMKSNQFIRPQLEQAGYDLSRVIFKGKHTDLKPDQGVISMKG